MKALRKDRYGNPVGDGSSHATYNIVDMTGFDVDYKVVKSNTSESVYITYYNNEDPLQNIKVRFSGHMNNAVKFGDELSGCATQDEILYRIGIKGRKRIDFIEPKVRSKSLRMFKKLNPDIEVESVSVSESDLKKLPLGTDISKYTHKLLTCGRVLTGTEVESKVDNRRYIFEYFDLKKK